MILNEEQQQVVYTTCDHVFLLAAAGSGKTRVIVERIKYLINNGVAANQILAITFTKKAAGEMKERINNSGVVVNTFHQYCYHLIKKNQAFRMISEIKHQFLAEETLLFSLYKNTNFKIKKPKGFDQYQAFLTSNNAKDFDDLLLDALPLAANHDFSYIFIDEFQDTNQLQFELLKKMINEKVKSLAVGDPDQSIYAFRGSNYRIIKLYLDTFGARLFKLSTNYRSDQLIIRAANKLISANQNRIEKSLVANSKNSGEFWITLDSKTDYDKIIEQIILVYRHTKDIAILYRFHSQGLLVKMYLERNNLTKINLMTIHEAKGLEFDCVFIIGLEVMPVLISNQARQVEEERRLLFVAVTRARKYLYIYSNKKTIFYYNLIGK